MSTFNPYKPKTARGSSGAPASSAVIEVQKTSVPPAAPPPPPEPEAVPAPAAAAAPPPPPEPEPELAPVAETVVPEPEPELVAEIVVPEPEVVVEESDPAPTISDVPTGTSFEVITWVDNDVPRAEAALAKEESEGTPRKTLIRELNRIIGAAEQ